MEACNATYAVLQNHNFTALLKPSAVPAYCTLPPIYDEKIAANVYDHVMENGHSQLKEGNMKEIHTYVEDDSLATSN